MAQAKARALAHEVSPESSKELTKDEAAGLEKVWEQLEARREELERANVASNRAQLAAAAAKVALDEAQLDYNLLATTALNRRRLSREVFTITTDASGARLERREAPSPPK